MTTLFARIRKFITTKGDEYNVQSRTIGDAEYDRIGDICSEVDQEIERLRARVAELEAACRHVLDDDGLIPRASTECRKMVRTVLFQAIPATPFHDAGAYARCSYCGRYSMDPKTLGDSQPFCECGKQHGWSGSFKPPTADSKWSNAQQEQEG